MPHLLRGWPGWEPAGRSGTSFLSSARRTVARLVPCRWRAVLERHVVVLVPDAPLSDTGGRVLGAAEPGRAPVDRVPGQQVDDVRRSGIQNVRDVRDGEVADGYGLMEPGKTARRSGLATGERRHRARRWSGRLLARGRGPRPRAQSARALPGRKVRPADDGRRRDRLQRIRCRTARRHRLACVRQFQGGSGGSDPACRQGGRRTPYPSQRGRTWPDRHPDGPSGISSTHLQDRVLRPDPTRPAGHRVGGGGGGDVRALRPRLLHHGPAAGGKRRPEYRLGSHPAGARADSRRRPRPPASASPPVRSECQQHHVVGRAADFLQAGARGVQLVLEQHAARQALQKECLRAGVQVRADAAVGDPPSDVVLHTGADQVELAAQGPLGGLPGLPTASTSSTSSARARTLGPGSARREKYCSSLASTASSPVIRWYPGSALRRSTKTSRMSLMTASTSPALDSKW